MSDERNEELSVPALLEEVRLRFSAVRGLANQYERSLECRVNLLEEQLAQLESDVRILEEQRSAKAEE